MARPFSNNMFQNGYEDFDRTGIMDPGIADVLNMRKEANAARDGATNQYEADVADFKNTQATEAEQGIASLPEATESATYMNNQTQAPSTETGFTDNPYVNAFKGKFPIGSDGEPVYDPPSFYEPDPVYDPFSFYEPDPVYEPEPEPVDNPYVAVFKGKFPIGPDGEPIFEDDYTNPYVEPVFDSYDPYVDPAETSLPEAEDSVTYVDPDEVIEYGDTFTGPATDGVVDIPETGGGSTGPNVGDIDPETGLVWNGSDWVYDSYDPNDPVSDYPFVDPVTGGDYVFVPGTPVDPGPGVVVTDPVTGELPPGYIPGGGDGPAGTRVEPYIPPRDPGINIYTGQPIRNPYRPFEQPSSSNYSRPMDPAEFGKAPGMNQGGRVPMGNNNKLNSGLSRLPINQQNDTLTQVFQSGFRPRR
jgi:hypothetical protein